MVFSTLSLIQNNQTSSFKAIIKDITQLIILIIILMIVIIMVMNFQKGPIKLMSFCLIVVIMIIEWLQ